MLALNHHSKKGFVNPLSGEAAKLHHWFPRAEKASSVNNNTIERVGFINRITPFLLFSTFLMGFFPYLMITHQGPVQSELLLAILFPFTVGSIFYTDNILWNYFQGKKLSRIWFLEIATALFFVFITKFM